MNFGAPMTPYGAAYGAPRMAAPYGAPRMAAPAPRAQQPRIRVLVTGATGNVGKATIAELKRVGQFEIFAGTSDVERAKTTYGADSGVTLVKVDGRGSQRDLVEAFRGMDAAFIISPSTVDRAELSFELSRAAAAAGVRVVILQSILSTGPAFPYGLDNSFATSFRALETEAAALFPPQTLAVLRLAMFVENFYGNMGSIKGDKTVYTPTGKTAFCQVALEDVARCVTAIILNPALAGATYDLTGLPVSAEQLTSAVAAEAGLTLKTVTVPDSAAEDAMQKMGMPAWQTTGITGLHKMARAGLFAIPSPDIERLTGRPPLSAREWASKNGAAFK